jgi:hypothetical protein
MAKSVPTTISHTVGARLSKTRLERAQQRDRRVARDQLDQHEDDESDPDQHRHEREQAAYDVEDVVHEAVSRP